MPSVPTGYSSESLQSFEESLMMESSSQRSSPIVVTKRPPLPPFRRPNSKLLCLTRSPSPCSLSSSLSCRSRSISVLSSRPRTSLDSSFATPPRRMFPLESMSFDGTEDALAVKEQAPVVFDASLNFVLGCEKQRVRQSFRPTASHMEPATASSYLSSKISQFLRRTDHIMDEWRNLGHRDDSEDELSLQMTRGSNRRAIGRSQSATNIMIRGYQYYSRSNSVGKSCSRRSLSRASEDRTISDSVGQEV